MITAIVEGPGDKRALPILIRRERGKTSVRCVNMRGKSNIVRRDRGFEDTVRRQHALGGGGFIVLMDGDVTCAPYQSLQEEREDMPRRAKSLEQELGVPIWVHWAVLEMESWLIGGIKPKSIYCGLRRVGRVPANTETEPRDPKNWLESHLPDSYYSPETQECLAQHIDLQEAQKHNQSMQVFLTNIR
jgi:hypothetical protein